MLSPREPREKQHTKSSARLCQHYQISKFRGEVVVRAALLSRPFAWFAGNFRVYRALAWTMRRVQCACDEYWPLKLAPFKPDPVS